MDIAHILRDILVVLIAAKLAAEGAERLGIPAVVGEIVAGIVIGPSVIGLVGGDEVLRTLGEIGVILLLLDVGLEMDLAELGKVGRASMSVATIGVVCPLLLGLGVMEVIGDDFNTSLFVAAALTATSVGITARVFGDLRALATTEARVVLGAAVADDVMGLVVLTVVVRLVTQGSVSILSVLGIVAVAVGFLVISSILGLRIAPPLFGAVERLSRSTGTLVAIALAFTLGFAELANSAKLAPIVGAFVAGIALTRSKQRERIRRELTPVGHLFIPVFFLQIGIDADVGAFGRLPVLRDAAILLVVAVVGKLVASVGAFGTRSDKWLVGLGMLPRGEVGLIFATIGLQNGVLGQDLYASLLLVVLVTTLVTPQLLKLRYHRIRAVAPTAPSGLPLTAEPPRGGWLRVVDGRVRLAATPPPERVLAVALDAALEVADARPSTELLEYLTTNAGAATWDRRAASSLRRVVERGNPRSWRFLETVGMLDRALPEIADTLRARQADPFLLDATRMHSWGTLERIRSLPEGSGLRGHVERLEHPEWLLLAAFLVEGLEGRPHPDRDAGEIARRLGYDPDAERTIVGLVADDGLLRRVAESVDAFDEDSVLQLASHLDTPERARATFVLAALRDDELDGAARQRLSTLHELVQRVLADPSLTGVQARNLVERHRAEAMLLARDRPDVVERLRSAPRSYVARTLPDVLVRHAALTEPPLADDVVRVAVTAAGEGQWWVEVGSRNRLGVLASVTGVLAEMHLDVDRAIVATWDDAAIESFLVRAGHEPDEDTIRAAVRDALERPVSVGPVEGATVEFDDLASAWHTVAEVRAPDSPGLLHSIAVVFAAASIDVSFATIGRAGSGALDRFEVAGQDGPRLTADERRRVQEYLATGVVARRRRLRRGFAVSTPGTTRPGGPASPKPSSADPPTPPHPSDGAAASGAAPAGGGRAAG